LAEIVWGGVYSTPPFTLQNKQGKHQGMAIDTLRSIAKADAGVVKKENQHSLL